MKDLYENLLGLMKWAVLKCFESVIICGLVLETLASVSNLKKANNHMPAWFFVTKWLSNLPQQKKGFLRWVFKRRCPWLQIANISNIIGLPIFFNFYQAQTSRVF